MSNPRSPGSFCSLTCQVPTGATGAQGGLNQLDTAALGDGAECYVTSNASTYRYNASSAQGAVGSSDVFVPPLVGSGCWFKQNSAADYAAEFRAGVSLFGSTVVPTGLTWAGVAAGANHFAADAITSPMWSINTTTGVITYVGPAGKRFLVQTNLSLGHSTVAQQNTELDLSIAGSLEGTQTNTLTCTQNTIGFTVNAVALSHSILFSPASGSTILPVYRVIDSVSGSIVFLQYQCVIVPIGP